MKLDCQMEVSGIEEIMLFRTLRFALRIGEEGQRYWEKFVIVNYDDNFHYSYRYTDDFLSNAQMMKKVKALAKNKKMHVWVSEKTLNIVRK